MQSKGASGEQFIRVEFPGGYAGVLAAATYKTLCENMRALAKSLENAEYVSAEAPTLRLRGGLGWWKQLFKAQP